MAHIIEIPSLTESMTHASISRWHTSAGATVREGDLLAELSNRVNENM